MNIGVNHLFGVGIDDTPVASGETSFGVEFLLCVFILRFLGRWGAMMFALAESQR